MLRALIFCLLLPSAVGAQLVTGRVLADDDGSPITGARVQLVDADGRARVSIETDSAGWFQLRAPSPGNYSIAVRHSAHLPYSSAPVAVRGDQSLEVQVRLGRQVIPLEPLVVVTRRSSRTRLSGFRERSTAPGSSGRFVTREEIDRRPGASVPDLVRTIPGVRVEPVKRGDNPDAQTTELITMRGTAGNCLPAILLDGTLVRQSSNFPIDDILRSVTLEGIEVYSSAATVPPEFQIATNCGALVLWTREASGGGRRGWLRMAVGVVGLATIVFLTF